MSSMITVIQHLYWFVTGICNDMGLFHVIQDYCNAVCVCVRVSIFVSIWTDMGSFHVIQDYLNAACVSILYKHM